MILTFSHCDSNSLAAAAATSGASVAPTKNPFAAFTTAGAGGFGAPAANFFSSLKPAGTEAGDDGEGDEEEAKPDPQMLVHKEDSVYQLFGPENPNEAVKLLYLSDANTWLTHGSGYLMIQQKESKNGYKMLIRANNPGKTVLLNINLFAGMPSSLGQKDKAVMISCHANPPLENRKDNTKTTSFGIT